MAKEFYTVKEAAEILTVKPQTIRAWLRKNLIAGQNIGGRRWVIPAAVIEQLRSGHSPRAKDMPSGDDES